MIKACIFDLDGTLTNTLDSLEYSVNETMKEIGRPQITKEQCRQFVGDGAKVLLERTLKQVGIQNCVILKRRWKRMPGYLMQIVCIRLLRTKEFHRCCSS